MVMRDKGSLEPLQSIKFSISSPSSPSPSAPMAADDDDADDAWPSLDRFRIDFLLERLSGFRPRLSKNEKFHLKSI